MNVNRSVMDSEFYVTVIIFMIIDFIASYSLSKILNDINMKYFWIIVKI